MFNVTVKTLDGINTSFSVDDEITVSEFKEKISEAVNIPASNQRLIFIGKVLANSNKLKSYNVADKVIHVVNSRPPLPSGSEGASNVTTAASTAASSTPSVSVSSVPSDMVGEMVNSMMQGLPSGDTMIQHIDMRRAAAAAAQHTESGRRVVLIRQWLRDSHSLLDRISNPSQGTRLSVDSMTTEARSASQVLPNLPPGSMAMSVTSATVGPRPAPPAPPSSTARQPTRRSFTPRSAATSSGGIRLPSMPTANSRTSVTDSNQSQTSRAPPTPATNPNVEVLSALWGEVDALNSRLHVHMHGYRDLLNNPGRGCAGHNQHMFNVISSVIHCLGHIYHALSDLHCDFGPGSNRQLTAAEAPAPPPTAIIQQTIPVTIPLRATVNVNSNTTRSSAAGSSVTSSAGTISSGSAPVTTSRPQSMSASTRQQDGIYTTSIELDMETDSGEDISEDGQRPDAADAQGAAGSLNGFTLSQLLQDAFSGISGMAGGSSTPPTTSAAASTQPAPSSGSNTAAAHVLSGSFGQFIPPTSAATAGNEPAPPSGDQSSMDLPPGFTLPSGLIPTPKDRQDPYLSSCSSKHWMSPAHSSTSSAPPAAPSGGRNSASASTSQRRSATPTSQRASASDRSTARDTTPNGRQVPRTSSNTSVTSSNSMSSARAPSTDRGDEARRQFLDQVRDVVINSIVEQPWARESSSRVPVPSVQRLNERVRDIFRTAAAGRAHQPSIADLHNHIQGSLSTQTSHSTQLGLLSELCSLLFKDLTIVDLYYAFNNQGQHFDRLRGPLRRFARSNILQDGSPSNENLSAAVSRLLTPIRSLLHRTVSEVNQGARAEYDIVESMCRYINKWLLDTISFLVNSKEGMVNYGHLLLDRLHQGFRNLVKLTYKLFEGATDPAALTRQLLVDIIDYCSGSSKVLAEALKMFVRRQMSTERFIDSINSIALDDLQQYLVRLGAGPQPVKSEASVYQDTVEQGESEAQTSTDNPNAAPPTQAAISPASLDTSSLSEASAADWRAVIPADWVAIIEEDIKRQLRLESSTIEQPLSDGYLDGRPQKRRRLSDEEDDEQ